MMSIRGCSLSFSTVLLHVVFSLPTLRVPSGVRVRAVAQWLLWSILSTCPIQLISSVAPLHFISVSVLFLAIVVGDDVWPVYLVNPAEALGLEQVFFLLSPSVIFHVWLPNSTTGWTSALNSFILVLFEYTEEFHVLFNLRKVCLPLFSLALISSVPPPFVLTVVPKYVNSSTSSMFILFTSRDKVAQHSTV